MEETKKYKIVFIDEEKIEFYGEPGANTMHAIYLEEYIQKYYQEHPTLGKLTYQTGANSLAYALAYFENKIIILNETRIGANGLPKYGTNVCLIVPNEISEKLKDKLLTLKDSLQNFSNFYVEKTEVIDNVLEGHYIAIDNNLSIDEKIESVINQVNNLDTPKR